MLPGAGAFFGLQQLGVSSRSAGREVRGSGPSCHSPCSRCRVSCGPTTEDTEAGCRPRRSSAGVQCRRSAPPSGSPAAGHRPRRVHRLQGAVHRSATAVMLGCGRTRASPRTLAGAAAGRCGRCSSSSVSTSRSTCSYTCSPGVQAARAGRRAFAVVCGTAPLMTERLVVAAAGRPPRLVGSASPVAGVEQLDVEPHRERLPGRTCPCPPELSGRTGLFAASAYTSLSTSRGFSTPNTTR